MYAQGHLFLVALPSLVPLLVPVVLSLLTPRFLRCAPGMRVVVPVRPWRLPFMRGSALLRLLQVLLIGGPSLLLGRGWW